MNAPSAAAPRANGETHWEIHPATSFDRFATQWDEVNEAAGGSPLLTSRFVALLLREFGSGREHLAICRSADRTEALALLRRKRVASVWQPFGVEMHPCRHVQEKDANRPDH